MNGELMAAEMAAQPEVLARVIARAPGDAAAVRAVVPDPLAGVVFLARGSSDNAAVFGRYLAELCAVVTVVDPELIVLGGGVGQAPGFAAAVTGELRQIAPVMPEVKVSALGTDAVVDGCLAAGADLAWAQLTVNVPGPVAAEVR